MATYAETIARICDDLSRPTDEIGDIAGREIVSAINYYSSHRFGFNERVISATLSSTNTYLFTALIANQADSENIMQIDDVKVTWSGREYTLEKTSWGNLFKLDALGTTTTIPDYWAVYDRRLRIYPTPNTTLPAQITAQVKLLTLDGATVINSAWLTFGEELIRSRACRMILQRKLDDFEKAQQYAQLEADAFRNLRKESNMKHESGVLASNP